MERCPGCRARYKGQTQCYRCGSDLTLVLEMEAEAKQWIHRAVQRFSEGAFDDADAALDRALMLHQTPLALSLLPFFRRRGALCPSRAAKAGSVLLGRIGEGEPDLNDVIPVSPVIEIRQRLGRWLMHPMAMGGMPYRGRLPSEPDGLIVCLGDAPLSRSGKDRLVFQAGRIVKNLKNAMMSRLTMHQAKLPEATPHDSLQPIKEATRAAAIEVHHALGPGLPASVYEECLCREFNRKGIPFKRRVPLSVGYKEAHLDSGYRMNLLLAGKFIVLIQGSDTARAAQRNQLLNYLRAAGWTTGLVIDFNVGRLKPPHLDGS